MKNLKKILIMTLAVFALSLLAPSVLPASGSNANTVEAAVKINKKKVTLTVGKSVRLKISGTNKKVKWYSTNKSVAKVSSKGKVVAKKSGTAKIIAKVGGKKYKCVVTVNKKIKYVFCDRCSGTGNCYKCHGTGDCSFCGGSGERNGKDCAFCYSGDCSRCYGSGECQFCNGLGLKKVYE